MFFLQEIKTKKMYESMSKSLKMDAYSEARHRVCTAASVIFVVAKYDLTAASTNAGRVSRFKVEGLQPESTHCSENTACCSENMFS